MARRTRRDYRTAEHYRKLRAQRRKKGLCTWCGKPSKPARLCLSCKQTPSYLKSSYVPKGVNKCRLCRLPGHNKRRCPAAAQKAAA